MLKEQLDLRDNQITEKNLNSISAGNAVGITIESGNAIEYVESLGAKGLAAEKVAREVAGKTREYIKNNTPVGEYLSDQLILPMLLGDGGEFVTSNISSHLKTNIDTANKILKENKIDSKTLRIEQTNTKYKIICE
ncbi:RNA 3'-terminal phosphate cyclase [Sessilibacter sp. MAH4]